MDFKEYQEEAYKMVKLHDSEELRICDWALGLGGEAGEVQEIIKHNVMHKEPIDLARLAKELGDLQWYVSAVATFYGIDLEVIARLNIAKLLHRHGGAQFSADGTLNRHALEEKFTDTPFYQFLMNILRREHG